MPGRKHLFLLSVLLASGSQTAVGTEAFFVWPNGAKAAVSLAYDDAVPSQLDNAIPALDKLGLKGSFYLTLDADTVAQRLAEWRSAAANGHELGNHTLFHQCSASAPDRTWVKPDIDLDNISAAQLAAQIRVGNSMLHAIDGKTERTFTAPCGDLKAGGSEYLPLVKDEFVAIKTALGGVVPDMRTLDPYAVSVAAPHDLTGEELIDQVKAAAKNGTMVNFTFHGVGGDHLSVSKEAHEQLLQYLADNKDVYWTDTFLNIMKHVKSEQARLD